MSAEPYAVDASADDVGGTPRPFFGESLHRPLSGASMLTLVLLVIWFFAILALGLGGGLEALWNGTPVGAPLALFIPLSLYLADGYWWDSRLFRGFWALDEK